MRIRSPFVLVVILSALVLGATPSQATLSFSVDTMRPDGSPVGLLQPGDEVVLDITVRSDGERTIGAALSVHGFDRSAASLVSGIAASSFLVYFPFGPGTGAGRLNGNGSVVLDPAGGRNGIDFFAGYAHGGTIETGENDISPVNGLVGGPQFRNLLAIHESLTLFVGSGSPTGGVIYEGGELRNEEDTELSFTVVPEPGTALLLGTGLVFLGGRRRH